MTALQTAFSTTYAQARSKFLAAAQSAGLSVQSHPHPLPGAQGELLAMDVVRDGPADAANVLIVSSACHGAEGFCGSGVQVHALSDANWHDHTRSADLAVLYIHGLNPHGFSHLRRVTHENVDINRNFCDFSQALPTNPAYRQLHDLLLPGVWPPSADNVAAIDRYVAENGQRAFQAAVSSGQYEFADGMFYGGQAPTWSNQTLRCVLREHARACKRLAWIDLHTGLGPSGVGERIFAGAAHDSAALARARRWWGDAVTSVYDGSSSSAPLNGMMCLITADECAQAECTAIAMEYGTRPLPQVILALRADHWLHQHPDAPADQQARIKQDLKDAFYVDSDEWREQIVEQALLAMSQAVVGLRSTAQ